MTAIITIIILHAIISIIFLLIFTQIMNSQTFNVKLILSIIHIIIVPLIFLIISTWVVFHHKYFKINFDFIRNIISKLKRRILKGYMSIIDSKPNKFKIFLSKYVHLISSLFIGTIYCFIEIYLIVNIQNKVTKLITNEGSVTSIIIYGILFLLIPIFLFCGLIFTVSYQVANKYVLLTVFLGGLIFFNLFL